MVKHLSQLPIRKSRYWSFWRQTRALNGRHDSSQFTIHSPVRSRCLTRARSSAASFDHVLEVRSIQGDLDYRLSFENEIAKFAIDPDSRWLIVILKNGNCELRRIADGEKQGQIESSHLQVTPSFLENGDLVLAWYGIKRLPKQLLNQLYEKPTIELPKSYYLNGASWNAVWDLEVSPQENWFAMASHDSHVSIWNLADWRLIRSLDQFQNEVWNCEFSPNQDLLAAGSERDGRGELTLWDTASWQLKYRIPIARRLVAGLSFHPFQPVLAVSSFDGSVWLVNTKTGVIIQNLVPGASVETENSVGAMDVQFSPDGRYLAAARKLEGVSIWEARELDLVLGLPDKEPFLLKKAGFRAWAVSFDSASRRLAIGFESGQVEMHRVSDFSSIATLKSQARRIRKLRFSSDGNRLVCSTWAAKSLIWDLEKLDDAVLSFGLPKVFTPVGLDSQTIE